MKKNDESKFKIQQTKLKTNAEKIADECSKGVQYHNENNKCQAEKSFMWSVKPKEYVQLKTVAKDKNCQVTVCNKKQVPFYKDKKCEYDDSKSQSPVKYTCSDKNCQELRGQGSTKVITSTI